MAVELFENLRVLEVYLENKNQKVLLCRDRNTHDLFLVNIFLNKRILESINYENLKRNLSSLVEIVDDEDAIYLVTRYFNYPNIKDYLSNNKIILSKQVGYTTYILDRLVKLKTLPAYAIYSLINHNNIFVDEEKNIRTLDLIVADYNYIEVCNFDIYKEIANILHIIFAGTEIVNNAISKEIPPDIEKIIINCTDNNYGKYEELINDFKSSKLYRLINPEKEEGRRVYTIRRNLYRRRTKLKIRKSAAVMALILAVLLPIIGFSLKDRLFKNNGDIDKVTNEISNNDLNDNTNNENMYNNEDNLVSDETEGSFDSVLENEEVIYSYFNDEIVKVSKPRHYGELDTENFYEGSASIKISNENGSKYSFFVGRIDINNDYFSYIKGRNIDLSMRLLSDKGEEALITVKVLGNGNLLSEISKKVYINSNVWTLHNINFDVGSGEYIEIYLTKYEKGNIWVDSYTIDILK